MSATLLTSNTRRCIRCLEWKLIDDFQIYNKRVRPVRRNRICKPCKQVNSYNYRARKKPTYQRRETVPVTDGLRNAVGLIVSHHGQVKIACSESGLSLSAYHKIMRGSNYSPTGKPIHVERRIAELVFNHANLILTKQL